MFTPLSSTKSKHVGCLLWARKYLICNTWPLPFEDSQTILENKACHRQGWIFSYQCMFFNIGLKKKSLAWDMKYKWPVILQKQTNDNFWLTQNCTSIAAGTWRVFQAFFPFLLVLPRVIRWLGLRMWVCCRQHHASDVLWSTYFLIKGEVPNPFSSTFADALPLQMSF